MATSFAYSSDRPRVGLALGGGSARGIAHVGVLEWLEENQIPVDFIAGTSMDGLIGGTFATGMSGAEIRAFLGSVDWDLVFLGGSAVQLEVDRSSSESHRPPLLFFARPFFQTRPMSAISQNVEPPMC